MNTRGASVELHISFPDNLTTEIMLNLKNIPCICRIGAEFEILFEDPLQVAHGIVTNWDRDKIDERAPAGTGGEYTHYCFGTVSLTKSGADTYDVADLAFFNIAVGWCRILKDGTYQPPGQFWDQEE
jgi:hypothetical protein